MLTPQAHSRRNARVILREEAATWAAISTLLDTSAGYVNLASDIRDSRVPELAGPGAHDLCVALTTSALRWPVRIPVTLSSTALLDRLESRCGAARGWALPFAGHLQRLSAPAHGPISLQGDTMAVVLAGLVVLLCPHMTRCPARGDVAGVLARPQAMTLRDVYVLRPDKPGA